jgi:alpha-glucosidase
VEKKTMRKHLPQTLLLLMTLLALLLTACAQDVEIAPTPTLQPPSGANDSLEVTSPNGRLMTTFLLQDGVAYYQVDYAGQAVILPSRLGFTFADDPPLERNLAIIASERSSFDETWSQPWGEVREIRNHYNELRVELAETTDVPRGMTLIFRVYDDGLGFRYELPEQENLGNFAITDELTEFAFAADHQAWWIPAYEENRYEYLYRNTS